MSSQEHETNSRTESKTTLKFLNTSPLSGDSVEVKGVVVGVVTISVVDDGTAAHPTWELLQLGQTLSDWYSHEAKSQQLKSP